MEESVDFIESIWRNFEIGDIEPGQMSPLNLAYIGDCVYEMIIKSYLLKKGNMQVNKLNKMTSDMVKAVTQSKLIAELEEDFTEEEMQIYKRGRNAKSYTSAKNASKLEYRRATGFEALIGYLFLKGEYERMNHLVKKGLIKLELYK